MRAIAARKGVSLPKLLILYIKIPWISSMGLAP
jgi:hypothetical protein